MVEIDCFWRAAWKVYMTFLQLYSSSTNVCIAIWMVGFAPLLSAVTILGDLWPSSFFVRSLYNAFINIFNNIHYFKHFITCLKEMSLKSNICTYTCLFQPFTIMYDIILFDSFFYDFLLILDQGEISKYSLRIVICASYHLTFSFGGVLIPQCIAHFCFKNELVGKKCVPTPNRIWSRCAIVNSPIFPHIVFNSSNDYPCGEVRI